MSRKGIWFLPRLPGCAPDFTYTEGGRLQLGTILESFNDPTSILFSPATDNASPAINWPPEETVGIEKNHEHSSTDNNLSVGGKILAKFCSIASASTELEIKREHALKFGKVDHKVVQFKYHLSPPVIQAILAQSSIKTYIAPNVLHQFVPRPIYVISGLRMAKESFSVAESKDFTRNAAASVDILASGSAAGADSAPVNAVASAPVGGSISGHVNREKNSSHSYETLEGKEVVFAYSMHVIRQRARLFADSSAFMTDAGDLEGVECVEVTEELEGLDKESILELEYGEAVYLPDN